MKQPSPYILLVLATLLWGGNFVIGRAVANDVPPYTLSLLRWCTAFLVFYPFVRKNLKTDWPAIKQHFHIVIAMAITGVAGFNTLVYISLHYTTSINASLVNSSTPIIIFVLSFLFFRERLHRNQLIGALISLSGVLFILSKGDWSNLLSFTFNLGDVLVVGAVVLWGVYSILVKQYAGRLPGYSTFFVAISLGLVVLLPFSFIELFLYKEVVNWKLTSMGAVAYIGIFASIVAFTSWNTAVAAIGPNKAGVFLNFIPVFASLFAIIFLEETLTSYQMIGGLFVVFGVYLSTKAPKKVPSINRKNAVS
ncbi:DMT family transporter [Bacillus sp. REN10]|uniref:DMT family transporter n=1 Tax=Bacillus sp. REN10 TaxID=2782541 RepID=UPI00193B33A5|nr:DMT family transporter [Bacillus sp. REN10]